MKKKLIIFLSAAMAISVMLGGCGDKEKETGSSLSETQEPEIYSAKEMLESTDYDVNDYVKLGKYKKISVEIDKSYEVTEENLSEAANEIITMTPYYVETEEAAENGDKVNIDYVGTMDGAEFDGGSASGYELVLGSNTFIDGFESGLEGYKAGDTVTLDLTFPEDYMNNEDYSGKDVTFEVTINNVYNAQEMTYDAITDDYIVQAFASSYGMTTVDQFNQAMNESLEQQRDVQIQKAYLEKLVEESEVTLPDGLLDDRVQQTMDSLQENCETYEMDLEEYIESYYGQSLEEYQDSLKEELETSLKEELVLEALVDKLQTEVSSDDFSSFVAYFASQYGMTEDQFMEQCGGKDYLILNYAEYYVALEEAAQYADVTYVDMSDEDADENTEEDAQDSDQDTAE